MPVKKRPVKKRSVLINGTKTSITLEDQYWDKLAEIAAYLSTTRPKLIHKVSDHREEGVSLSSSLRLFVLSESNRIARESRDAA